MTHKERLMPMSPRQTCGNVSMLFDEGKETQAVCLLRRGHKGECDWTPIAIVPGREAWRDIDAACGSDTTGDA